jgi:AcrR family transcriptional regulator
MPRPNQTHEKRKALLPIVARTFAELGYRRATTAELARRCDVRQNILYRLWPDKKAMFIASIDYVYEQAAGVWQEVLDEAGAGEDAALRLLRYEARHYGESGLHRIILAGLSETDEPAIREALRKMYGRFHRFIRGRIADHRAGRSAQRIPSEAIAAWAIVGLGNVANIGRELGLLSHRAQAKMFADAGRLLLDGRSR